jgi:hypothetical protein
VRARTLRETRRERRELAADAGFGGFSFTSMLAGVLVAYGAFAILLGLAAAAVGAAGGDTDLSTDWEQLGTAGGLAVAGLLFLAYLFGGYVAGRMARRNGLAHGAGVLVLGVLIVGAVAYLVRSSAGTGTIADNLRSLGIPTTAEEYGQAGSVAGLASLVALIAGALVGGALGERWHARLFARAADPTVGAQAQAAREAEAARTRANLTLARSEPWPTSSSRSATGTASPRRSGPSTTNGSAPPRSAATPTSGWWPGTATATAASSTAGRHPQPVRQDGHPVPVTVLAYWVR